MGNQPLHETTHLVASGLRLSGWRNPMQRFSVVVAMGSGWKFEGKMLMLNMFFVNMYPLVI
jgi:hypothetical protein